MAEVISDLLKSIEWPEGYEPEDPPFTLLTVEEMTAAQWIESQDVDFSFISISKPASSK